MFDFFGTLTTGVSHDDRRAGAVRLAAALGVDADALTDVLNETFYERATGRMGDDTAAMLDAVARRCGGKPGAGQLAQACRVRWENESALVRRRLRPEAPEVLAAVAGRGLRVGVPSDCTHELPQLWPELPVSEHVTAAVFSITERRHKPDPLLYRKVARRMGVEPSGCLYVGDGGSNELTGAATAGMMPVLLDAPDGAGSLVHRREEGWRGAVVRSLPEVVGLL